MGAPTSLAVAPSATTAADVRVVVIDNHADRRQLMGYVLGLGSETPPRIAYADNAISAGAAVERIDANAVLLEIQIPVADGLEAISTLRDAHPELRIVVCSFHVDSSTRAAALARGAAAYLLKPLRPAELYRALRAETAPPTTTKDPT